MMCSLSRGKKQLSHIALISAMTCVMTPVQAMDLVAFGKACLKQESYLTKLKHTIDDAELTDNTLKNRNNGTRDNLRSYTHQLSELQSELDECQRVAPNSRYCHDTRIRYNRLSVLADRSEHKLDNKMSENADDRARRLFFQKQHYENAYQEFINMCRNSDIHYQLLQDPNAYARVCSSSSLKKTTTCSFF